MKLYRHPILKIITLYGVCIDGECVFSKLAKWCFFSLCEIDIETYIHGWRIRKLSFVPLKLYRTLYLTLTLTLSQCCVSVEH